MKAVALEKQILHLDGALAEFFGGEGYGFPLWASCFHEFSVIVEADGEKDVPVVVKIVKVPPVEVDVDVFNLVGKDKNCGMAGAECLLPTDQTVDIVGGNPAFKAR